MSHQISLLDERGVPASVDPFEDGVLQTIGGATDAEVNVPLEYDAIFKFKTLNGRKAGDTIQWLEQSVIACGNKRDPNIWEPTRGNVGAMLALLLLWATTEPEATWKVE
jgi:hypothetical protein